MALTACSYTATSPASPAASHCVASVRRAAPRHARHHMSLPRRQACRRGCEGLPSPSASAAVVAPARAGRPRLPAVCWSPLPSSPCASLCGPSRPQAAPPRAATVRLPVRRRLPQRVWTTRRGAGAALPSAAASWPRVSSPPSRRCGAIIHRVACGLPCTRKAYGWRAASTFSAVIGKSWMRTPTAS
jgi:hypothetical protein